MPGQFSLYCGALIMLATMVYYSRQELLDLRVLTNGNKISIPVHIYNRLRDYNLLAVSPTKRGCRSGKHVADYNNTKKHESSKVNFCLFNARSVCNKTSLIVDYISEQYWHLCHNGDVALIWPRWTQNDYRGSIICWVWIHTHSQAISEWWSGDHA